jgi:hypothetical protein
VTAMPPASSYILCFVARSGAGAKSHKRHSGKPWKINLKCSLRSPCLNMAGGSLSGVFGVGLALDNTSTVVRFLGCASHLYIGAKRGGKVVMRRGWCGEWWICRHCSCERVRRALAPSARRVVQWGDFIVWEARLHFHDLRRDGLCRKTNYVL